MLAIHNGGSRSFYALGVIDRLGNGGLRRGNVKIDEPFGPNRGRARLLKRLAWEQGTACRRIEAGGVISRYTGETAGYAFGSNPPYK
jgi:hypothetical protein